MSEAPTSSFPPAALERGTIIAGRYELIRPLGTGGMGTVYLAQDKVLGQEHVAIKVLRNDFVHDDSHTKRFLREVQLMRRVNHRNVVRTFDVGVDESTVYFTMEYVPGQSLAKLCENQSLSHDELANLIMQISEGLGAIHQAGIIHRDLKPGNIIVLPDGGVKITDFGVARPEVSDLTAHNEVIGSANYMAPEAWSGKELSGAIDFYSLGIILYEIVTGQSPYQGRSPAQIMRLHIYGTPQPPIDLNRSLHDWLNRLIIRLLEKDPKARPKCDEIIELVKSQSSASQEQLASEVIEFRGEGGDSLVSSSLIQRLEEASTAAVDEARSVTSGLSGSFDKLTSPSASLRWHRVTSLFGRSSLLISSVSFASFAISRLLIAAGISFGLSFGLSMVLGSAQADAGVSTNVTSFTASLENLLTNFLRLLGAAAFPFSLILCWTVNFPMLGRATSYLFYWLSFMFIGLTLIHISPALFPFTLTPLNLVMASSIALSQISHLIIFSPTVPVLESSLLSSGLVFSPPVSQALTDNPFFALLSLAQIALTSFLMGLTLKRIISKGFKFEISLFLFLAFASLAFQALLPSNFSQHITLTLPHFELVIASESLTFISCLWFLLIPFLALNSAPDSTLFSKS